MYFFWEHLFVGEVTIINSKIVKYKGELLDARIDLGCIEYAEYRSGRNKWNVDA